MNKALKIERTVNVITTSYLTVLVNLSFALRQKTTKMRKVLPH